MIKYNTYKTVSRINLYGDKDELLNNPQSVYKTNKSQYKNCKKFKFSMNGSVNHLQQLSNNARLMLESSNIQVALGVIPTIWYQFDNPSNVGLDTMGVVNLVLNGSYAPMTYDNTISKKGTGSLKGTAGQTLLMTYNFSHFENAITIAFWIRINQASAYNMVFKDYDGFIYLASSSNVNNMDVALFGSGYQDGIHFSGVFVADNIWKHLTLTAEKTSSGETKITSYLNGVFNTTATSGTWSKNGLVEVNFSDSYYGYSFIGNLDDFRMYNKVLTPEEINSLYLGSLTEVVESKNVITRLCTSTNDNTTESINSNTRYPIISVSRTNEPFYNSMKAYQSLNVPSNFLQKGYIEFEIEYPNSSYDITSTEFKNSNFSLVITDEDNQQVSDNNNIVDFSKMNINVPIKYY